MVAADASGTRSTNARTTATAVDVAFIDSREPPNGLGEPGVPPLAPALANAIFAATGVRLRRTPILPDLRPALAATPRKAPRR
jgi:CO/xanthine dehydrogenase Mo-binding subunit